MSEKVLVNISDHLINTEGFVEQDIPELCPVCHFRMTWANIVGWGNYPRSGHRGRMKPNALLGIGYGCPKCDFASIHHATLEYIKDVIECEWLRREAQNE